MKRSFKTNLFIASDFCTFVLLEFIVTRAIRREKSHFNRVYDVHGAAVRRGQD